MYLKCCQLQSPAKAPRQGKGGAEGKYQVNRNPVLMWYMKINTVAALFIFFPVCLLHFSFLFYHPRKLQRPQPRKAGVERSLLWLTVHPFDKENKLLKVILELYSLDSLINRVKR